MQRTNLLIASLVMALIVAACATTGTNRGDFNLISLEEEWQLGRRLEADLARELRLVDDASARRYLDQVAGSIVAQTDMRQLPWKFHIVADSRVNAFNIPGGHVYVNTGLIDAAPDAAAFAGVLAHEISHGVARHATEQLSKAYGINILGAVVLGQNPAVYEQILAQVVAGGAMASFSRDAEREADHLGVRFMYGADYDPAGMARMFEVLLEQRRREPGTVERFFASHPLTEDRIGDVQQAAASLPPKPGLIRTDPQFENLQDRLGP